MITVGCESNWKLQETCPHSSSWEEIKISGSARFCGLSSYQVSAQSDEYCRLWINLKISRGAPPQRPWEEIAKSGTMRLCAPMSRIIMQSFNIVGHVISGDETELFTDKKTKLEKKLKWKKNWIVNRRMDGRTDKRTDGRTFNPFYKVTSERWPENCIDEKNSFLYNFWNLFFFSSEHITESIHMIEQRLR